MKKTNKPAVKKAAKAAVKKAAAKKVIAPVIAAAAVPVAAGLADPRLPAVGTILTREFRGRTAKVEVLRQGFQFEKRRYTSLSAIAKEVVKGNRNGFEFFGLNAKAA